MRNFGCNLLLLFSMLCFFPSRTLALKGKPSLQYDLLSIMVFFCLSSCAPYQLKSLTKTTTHPDTFINPYFSDPDQDYLYKARIEAFGNFFGGILVVKKQPDHHRVVFTTEFGAKLFDFEMGDESFKVNYAVEVLDRKVVINNLRKSFELLLRNEFPVTKCWAGDGGNVYLSKRGKTRYYGVCEEASGRLVSLWHYGWARKKVVYSFSESRATYAKNIRIEHQRVPLKIELAGLNF